MQQYSAKLTPDGESILVTFPAIPEAVTGGADEAEALANAREALELAVLTYVLDGRPIPRDDPGPGESGQFHKVPITAAVAAKIAFVEAFRQSGLTRVALAARLGKAEGEVRRMLDPYHATKLGAIESGLRALGKRLVVHVEENA